MLSWHGSMYATQEGSTKPKQSNAMISMHLYNLQLSVTVGSQPLKKLKHRFNRTTAENDISNSRRGRLAAFGRTKARSQPAVGASEPADEDARDRELAVDGGGISEGFGLIKMSRGNCAVATEFQLQNTTL